MTNDPWKQLILKTKPDPAPDRLLRAIIARISEEKAARPARQKFFAYTALSFLSGAALVFALIIARAEFAKSDFPAFLTLIWTDSSIVLAYWKSYLSSLAETLPIMSVILVFTTIFALINFLRMAAKNISGAHLGIRHKIA
jgi:ABC-type phosphate/phosphonate transport system permease subunit